VIKYKDTEVKTKADVQKKLTLDNSVDGDGLKHHSDVPYVHSWVSDGTSKVHWGMSDSVQYPLHEGASILWPIVSRLQV